MDWFASYLADINQCVKVGDVLSDPADLIYGVHQGSVLGPTPLNKILSTYKTVNYHFYEDDTQLYISLIPINFATAIATFQTCLADVQSWMTTNKLNLNPDKTEFILLGNKSQRENLAAYYPVDILGSVISLTVKARNVCIISFLFFLLEPHCIGMRTSEE